MTVRLVLGLLSLVWFVGCASREKTSLPINHMVLHRGNPRVGQGNTIAGIRGAIEQGVLALEVDVRRGVDGTFFLFHDRRVHPENSSAPRYLWGRDVESLNEDSRRFLCDPWGKNCPPTLGEVFEEIAGQGVTLFLDIKRLSPKLLDRLLEVVATHGVASQVVIQCPIPACGALVRQMDPSIRVVIRISDLSELPEALRGKPYAVQLDPQDVTPYSHTLIKAQGVLVMTKTVDTDADSPRGLSAMIERGADLVLTDLLP